jgi:hypothetical protein
MIRLAVALVMLGLSAAIPMWTAGADPARAPRPMAKGVELYSWKDSAGNWRYSLLPGTNRLKTRDEIVSEGVVVKDVPTLKRRLSALAVDEQVFWLEFDAPEFSIPDSAIVADVVAYARIVQVTVQVLQ